MYRVKKYPKRNSASLHFELEAIRTVLPWVGVIYEGYSLLLIWRAISKDKWINTETTQKSYMEYFLTACQNTLRTVTVSDTGRMNFVFMMKDSSRCETKWTLFTQINQTELSYHCRRYWSNFLHSLSIKSQRKIGGHIMKFCSTRTTRMQTDAYVNKSRSNYFANSLPTRKWYIIAIN